jgi:hypothetical protein
MSRARRLAAAPVRVTCALGLCASLLVVGPAPATAAQAAEPPRSAPAPATAGGRTAAPRPDDEEVIRNLELLEQLELLRRLELFDAAGDDDRAGPAPAPEGKGPAR